MRQYILTDRDFEDFYNIMVAVEAQVRAEFSRERDRTLIEKVPASQAADQSLRTSRYHFIGWRNRVMSGDVPGKPMDYPTLEEPPWLKLRLKQLGLLDEDKKDG